MAKSRFKVRATLASSAVWHGKISGRGGFLREILCLRLVRWSLAADKNPEEDREASRRAGFQWNQQKYRTICPRRPLPPAQTVPRRPRDPNAVAPGPSSPRGPGIAGIRLSFRPWRAGL